MYSSALSFTSALVGDGWLTPLRSSFIPGNNPELSAQKTGWILGPIWTSVKNLAPTGILFSYSLVRCSYFIRTSFFVLTVVYFVFLYFTYNTQQTNIHAPGGIQTRNPSKRPQTYALDRAATGIGSDPRTPPPPPASSRSL